MNKPKVAKIKGRTMRFLLGSCFVFAVVISLVLAFGTGPLFLQDQPSLKVSSAPAPEDVAAMRYLVRAARDAAGDVPDASRFVRTNAEQLNNAIRLGARFRYPDGVAKNG